MACGASCMGNGKVRSVQRRHEEMGDQDVEMRALESHHGGQNGEQGTLSISADALATVPIATTTATTTTTTPSGLPGTLPVIEQPTWQPTIVVATRA